MKQYHFLERLPENAVFWLFLFFLAAGSAASLHGKITGRTETAASGRVLSQVAVIPEGAARSMLSPISHIDSGQPGAVLTFDLNGGSGNFEQIVDTLQTYGAPAAFFISAQWMAQYPKKVKELAAQGHDLGIYAGTLVNYRNLSQAEIKKEILSQAASLKELTGRDPVFFRPPYGDPENPCAAAAAKLGYIVVAYDCDSLDWKNYGAAAVTDRILTQCRPENGSILLFRGNGKYTADALGPVLEGLKEAGVPPVSLSGMFPGS